VFVNLGFSLGALKRDEEARRMFSEALTAGEVWHNLGLVYLKRGERVAAERAYQRALEEDPRLSQAREALELLKAHPPRSSASPELPELPAPLEPRVTPTVPPSTATKRTRETHSSEGSPKEN